MKFLILGLFFININLFGQVKLKDLQGYWVCPNQDSSYFKNDTLILIQSKGKSYIHRDTFCEYYDWEITKNYVQIREKYLCKEPPYEKYSIFQHPTYIEIVKSKNLTFLILEKYGFKITEIFLVLNLETLKFGDEGIEKHLQLKRLDFIKR